MIPVPTGVRVWLATRHTDMRKGFAAPSLQVQEALRRGPLSGQLFCFAFVSWGNLFTKGLEPGRLLWPSAADSAMTISSAQFG